MADEKLTNIRVKPKKIPNVDKIDRKKLKTIRVEQLPLIENVGGGTVTIFQSEDTAKVYIERLIDRNRVRNMLDQYECVEENNKIVFKSLDLTTANSIVDRAVSGRMHFNDCFVFGDFASKDLDWKKSESEHKFTSTGIKFWRHQEQMLAFREKITGNQRNTIISTHISPEGSCNLACSFCSVTYRDTHSRIELPRIQKYVTDLKSRGLKAVILTGGGEPTLYPYFNELVQWIKYDQKLSVALITNGTTGHKIDDTTLKCFSWIRVSVNIFPGWEEKIDLKKEALNSDCIVGCSMVFTVEHTARNTTTDDRLEIFTKVSKIADKIGAKYVRLLPNCLLKQDRLLLEHEQLQNILKKVDDPRFFQQYKIHGAPKSAVCHQAYFRPYLSEEPSKEDGEPGAVYPCDSVVLNDTLTHFAQKFQLCKPENILDFIDGKIKQEFNPQKDCTGCVFTQNVNLLDSWLNTGDNRFQDFQEKLTHEEFV